MVRTHGNRNATAMLVSVVLLSVVGSLWIAPSRSLAQDGTLFVEGDNVGIGTPTPSHPIHVKATDGTAKLLVEETGGGSFEELMELFNEDGNVGFRLRNPDGLADFNKIGNEFRINLLASPPELRLDAEGDLIIRGSLTTQNPFGTFPDFVFEPDYELMPLDELGEFVRTNKHLPEVVSASEVEEAGGVNVSRLQLQLLQKVEELTLYLVEQSSTIEQQAKTIEELRDRLAALEREGR